MESSKLKVIPLWQVRNRCSKDWPCNYDWDSDDDAEVEAIPQFRCERVILLLREICSTHERFERASKVLPEVDHLGHELNIGGTVFRTCDQQIV